MRVIAIAFFVMVAAIGVLLLVAPRSPNRDRAEAATASQFHVAGEGETYESIGIAYDVDADALREYNMDREITSGAIIQILEDDAAPRQRKRADRPANVKFENQVVGQAMGDIVEVKEDCQGLHELAANYGLTSADIVEVNIFPLDAVDCMPKGLQVFIPKEHVK